MARTFRVSWLFALTACVLGVTLCVPAQDSAGEEDLTFEQMPEVGTKARAVFENLLTYYEKVTMGEMTRFWEEPEVTADDAQAMRDLSQQALAHAEHRIDAARRHWRARAMRLELPRASWDVLPTPWEEWIEAHQRFITNTGGAFFLTMREKVAIVAKEEVVDGYAVNDTDRWETYVKLLSPLNEDLERSERLCDRIAQGGRRVDEDRKALQGLLPRFYVWQAALMNWAVVFDDMQKRGNEILEDGEWTSQAVEKRMKKFFEVDTPRMKGTTGRLDSSMLMAFHDWEQAAMKHVEAYKAARDKFEAFSRFWMGGDRNLYPGKMLPGRTGWEVLEAFQKCLRRAEHHAK